MTDMKGLFFGLVIGSVVGLPSNAQVVPRDLIPVSAYDAPICERTNPVTKLNVSVWDSRKNEPIKNLDKEDFEIEAGKDRRKTEFFRHGDEPVSIGILLDLSGSMQAVERKSTAIPLAMEGLKRFLALSNPKNEYFVLGFSTSIYGASEFTSDRSKVEAALNDVLKVDLKGNTNLYDGINFGLNRISDGKFARKILILLSDGLENASKKYDHKTIRNNIRRCSDVIMYLVDTSIDSPGTFSPYNSSDRVEEITEESGGRVFHPTTKDQVSNAFEVVAGELKSQYTLEISTSDAQRPWRKVKVSVKPPKPLEKIIVRAPKGCFC